MLAADEYSAAESSAVENSARENFAEELPADSEELQPAGRRSELGLTGWR